MREWLWAKVAAFCTRPRVFAALVRRAERRPYRHIVRKGAELYMARFWLFNAYRPGTHSRRWAWLPSVRIHYIAAPDLGPEHSHPWTAARSIILSGWYMEEREGVPYFRGAGKTSTIKFGEYHRITQVSPRGCWSLFVMYRDRGPWDFKSK